MLAFSLGLSLLIGCDSPRLTFLWRTVVHPTYHFSVRVPPSWEVIRDAETGADLLVRPTQGNPLFRASANIVVETRAPDVDEEAFAARSEKHLEMILRNYMVLSRARTSLGDLRAIEIRGRYRGGEGDRILRTIIASHSDLRFVLTLSCGESEEEDFQATFEAIRSSFQIHKT